MSRTDVRAQGDKSLLNKLKDDPLVQQWAPLDEGQLFQWIDDNVTDLASAKDVLKRLLVHGSVSVRDLLERNKIE